MSSSGRPLVGTVMMAGHVANWGDHVTDDEYNAE
jgi:hypothetical protein